MTFSREKRSAMKRGAQRTLTLDDSAVASDRAGLRVSPWRWSRRYPRWPLILGGSTVLNAAALFLSPFFLVALPITLVANLFYWVRVREHFQYGDANPGLVVSSSPLLIAVWTDLAKGEGSYPVLRVLREEPAKEWGTPPAVGTRVATVGLYDDGDAANEDPRRWGRFEPRPVELVASAAADAQRLLEGFSPERWERLERAIRELGRPREGLHRVELGTSSWRELEPSRA